MSASTGTRKASSMASDVTIILHTRNRADFLARTLAHLSRMPDFADLSIDVVDGSQNDHWPRVERACQGWSSLCRLEVHHSPPEVTFRERISKALERCTTPYVMLAADDDFYLPGWLAEAVATLDAEQDIGTVHGHALFFALPAYVPYGSVERYFIHPRAVPPLPWLEEDSPSMRAMSLTDGTHEGSVPGWYALQRTRQLTTFIDDAMRVELPDEYFEYMMNFYQTVLGKQRMLDRIIVARQEDAKAIRRSPTLAESAPWRAVMRSEFIKLLQAQEPGSRNDAEVVVDRYLKGVGSELRRLGDRAWLLRIRAHPITRFVARYLLRRPPLARDMNATHYPDPRLPPIPKVGEDHPAVRLVRKATSAPA